MGDARLNDPEHQNLLEQFEHFEQKKFEHVPMLKEVLNTLDFYKTRN